MGQGFPETRASTVMVDDAFANQDEGFVERLRQIASSQYLAGLADRWKQDPRPWAREQVLQYLAKPLDRPGHHPLVKRLFKQAEAKHDHELMAAFLVAFDRLIRRRRRVRYQYDWQTRQTTQSEELFAPHDQILPAKDRGRTRKPRTGERINLSVPIPKYGKLFSYKTRGYLRRRAARYFRRLGFQQPSAYPRSVASALALYRDEDVASGENILDNWSLMQIGFRRSPVLEFRRTRVELADGRSLGELAAAPRFEDLWRQPESAAVLLNLLTAAQSRLVRVWTIQLLKRDHGPTLQSITAVQLLSLLDHSDDEVQQFGAGLLKSLTGIDSWPIATWLKLLETRSVTALATITDVMNQRVRRDRLNLEQCVSLACARPTPVARLGLAWLSGRPAVTAQDRSILGKLATARCDAVGGEAATFALAILGSAANYNLDVISPFFDSLNAEVRRGAWEWLTPQSPGYADPALWCRLLETPYEDVRLRLVESLHQRATASTGLIALREQELSQLWSAVLLGVHRGGRTKIKALRQISQAIADHPERAEALIPVLAVAIRSVRPSEARTGLSALLTAVAARPELEALLSRQLPELRLGLAEVTP